MTLSKEYATISIIGPVNVGKSSILATFGNLAGIMRPKIDPIPGTDPTDGKTDETNFFIDRLTVPPYTPYLRIQDSWGFQESCAVLDQLKQGGGPITLETIIGYCKNQVEQETNSRRSPFLEDLQAWNKVENCDIVLYVIDATHDPRMDHLAVDSLELLRACERPVIALFNFYSADMGNLPTYVPQWKKVLKTKNVFHVCDYDALHRSFDEEIKLLRIAASLKGGLVLSETQAGRIEESIRQRKGKENMRIAACRNLLAELLFDVGTCTVTKENVRKDDIDEKKKRVTEELYGKVYLASIATEKKMLDNWQFAWDIMPEITEESYCDTIFGQSVDATAGGQEMPWHHKAISGGMVGIGVITDFFGGMGLGTAAALALAGSLFGKSLIGTSYNYFSRTYTITAKPNVEIVKRLVDRFSAFQDAIRSRGQAADNDMQFIVRGDIDRPLPTEFIKVWVEALSDAQGGWLKFFTKPNDLCLIDSYKKTEEEQMELSPAKRQVREDAVKKISGAIENCFEEFKPVP